MINRSLPWVTGAQSCSGELYRTCLRGVSPKKVEVVIHKFFAAKDGKDLYSQQKQDQELTVAQIMKSSLQNSDLN